MSIRFRCHSCGKKLKARDSARGKRTRCPECGEVLTVAPEEEEQPEGAPAPAEPAEPAEQDAPAEPGGGEPPARGAVDLFEGAGGAAAEAPAEETAAPKRPSAPKPDDAAVLGIKVPSFQTEAAAEPMGWLPNLVLTGALLLGLGQIGGRGYVVAYLNFLGPQGPGFGEGYFRLLTNILSPLMIFLGIGVLVAAVAAWQRKGQGRNWLLLLLPAVVLLHGIYVVMINLSGFYPPGGSEGVDWRLMEAVGLIVAVLIAAPAWVYLWQFASRFRGPRATGRGVVDVLDQLLREAVRARASDVHLEPTPEGVSIRYRIDGVLHPIVTYPLDMLEKVVSRIKVMGNMDIAERRLPQDGGATMTVDGRGIDLRISTVPSSFGERAVVRLLDPETSIYGLEGLGLGSKLLDRLDHLIHHPHGVFFCTGPTGSGKTTTLYAAMLRLNTGERNILTVEDPVEYQLPGISQLPVGKKKGMSFVSGLRSILRQDPDVIMVGEVRDSETASMVVRAAQTGHMVLSTLHTNDSAGAVARLLDLGCEPSLLSSALTAVLAQRLVRRVCPNCGEEYRAGPDELRALGRSPEDEVTLKRGRGCPQCLNTGYRGRIGLFELLAINDPVRELIVERVDARTIRRAALETGMESLRQDGLRKVLAGITTMAEVDRVTEGSVHESQRSAAD